MNRRTFLQISALALTALGLASAAPEMAPELVRMQLADDHAAINHKGGVFWNDAIIPQAAWGNAFFTPWPVNIKEFDLNNLDPDLIPGHVTFTWEDGRTETVRALVKRSEPQKIFALEV